MTVLEGTMAEPEPVANTLARSQRAAAIGAAVSSVFGAALIVWGV